MKLLIVINGHDVYVDIDATTTLAQARRRVLYDGSYGENFDRWELRCEPGALLDTTDLAARYTNQPLYLTPPVGFSG